MAAVSYSEETGLHVVCSVAHGTAHLSNHAALHCTAACALLDMELFWKDGIQCLVLLQNFTVDQCGPVHITMGDGGNIGTPVYCYLNSKNYPLVQLQ